MLRTKGLLLIFIFLIIASAVLASRVNEEQEEETAAVLDAMLELYDGHQFSNTPSSDGTGANTLLALGGNPTKCVQIYGNFCGPGWCDGKWWSGCGGSSTDISRCARSKAPKDAVDTCCKNHDACCVANRGSCSSCDSNLISCLGKAKCGWNFACEAAK